MLKPRRWQPRIYVLVLNWYNLLSLHHAHKTLFWFQLGAAFNVCGDHSPSTLHGPSLDTIQIKHSANKKRQLLHGHDNSQIARHFSNYQKMFFTITRESWKTWVNFLIRLVGGHLLNKDLPESAFLVTLKKLKENLQTEINRVLPDATLNNDLSI